MTNLSQEDEDTDDDEEEDPEDDSEGQPGVSLLQEVLEDLGSNIELKN